MGEGPSFSQSPPELSPAFRASVPTETEYYSGKFMKTYDVHVMGVWFGFRIVSIMATTGPLQQGRSEQYCIEHGALVATELYYRLSLSISFITSIASASTMIYFLHRHYRSSLFFHNNLRVLFLSLSVCCLSYAVINTGMKAHHLTLSFTYTTPCDLFLPKALYITMTIPLTSVWIASQIVLVFIMIERWSAVVFLRDYELGFRKLGPTLIAAALLVTTLICFSLYYGETFDGPQINGRVLPSTRYIQGNVLIFVLLVTNFIGFTLTIALRFARPKWQIRMPLSLKFQSKENAIASNLLFWISTIQFTAFFFTQLGALYVRIYLSKHPLSPAYKENIDLFNFYTLVLPALSTLYLVRVKRQRIKDIKDNVNIRANGNDGWLIYSSMFQKQWM